MEQLRSKVLLVLLVLAVTFGSASVAMAQGVVFTGSALPRSVRVEGRTETVGEITLLPNNTSGAIPANSTINILYSAAIADTTVSSYSAATNVTCFVTGTGTIAGGAPPCNFAAAVSGNQLTLTFTGAITFTPATAGTVNSVTIFGIRVNASAVAGQPSITATLSGSSTNPSTFPITFNPTQPVNVGTVLSSITAVVNTAGNFLTCNFVAADASIDVTEVFPSAMTSTAQELAFSNTPVVTNGTRLRFSFFSVPNGVKITPGIPIAIPLTTIPLFTTFAAAPAAATATATVSTLTFDYSFTATDLGNIEGAEVPFTVSVTAGFLAPLLTTVSVTAQVSVGPVSTTSTTVARFASNAINTPADEAFTVSDCVTNLLYPFVANTAGFDTGIAIANTTSDDVSFGTGLGLTAQNGPCTVTLYPTNADGTAGTPVSTTTASIAAGATNAFSISGVTSFAGKQGYAIAVCQFLGGHSLAFIVNNFGVGVPTIAHGYLALIIPGPRATVPGGESLGE